MAKRPVPFTYPRGLAALSREERWDALCKTFRIPAKVSETERWSRLASYLAYNHIPAFADLALGGDNLPTGTRPQSPPSLRDKWTEKTRKELRLAVEVAVLNGRTVSQACVDLARVPRWSSMIKSNQLGGAVADALMKQYYKAPRITLEVRKLGLQK